MLRIILAVGLMSIFVDVNAAAKKVEHYICARCCNSSSITYNKEMGLAVYRTWHYSCCYKDKAVDLMRADVSAFFAKHPHFLNKSIAVVDNTVTDICCIKGVGRVIGILTTQDPMAPYITGSKPATVHAKRD